MSKQGSQTGHRGEPAPESIDSARPAQEEKNGNLKIPKRKAPTKNSGRAPFGSQRLIEHRF